MGWLRALFKLLRTEFFYSWPQGASSAIAILVAALSAIGIVFKVGDLGVKFTPDQSPFLPYVWTTFIVSTVCLAATALLLQRLTRRHEDISKLKAQLGRGMVLQHHMAETVRIAAAKREETDLSTCLDRVLGAGLREYLKLRLGDFEVHCTVKGISPLPGGGYELTDIFRDDGQDKKARPRGEKVSAEENFIYSRFKRANIDDAKRIYIPDVNSGGVWEELSSRAHSRGYRCVLAIPLNLPAGPAILDRTVGFLGLDSPQPHAFDGLFEFCRKEASPDIAGSSDGVYKPLEELNFLYSIADSLATILMLVQSPPPNGSNS